MGKERLYPGDDWEQFLNDLGLTSRPVSELFGKDSANVRFLRDDTPDNRYVPRIEVHTIRPAFRAGREGRQIEQVVVTLTQRVTADIGEPGQRKRMVFRGGCSLILSLGDLNTVEYVILKNIKSYDRFCRQAAYVNGEDPEGAAPSRSLYASDDREWRLRLQPAAQARIMSVNVSAKVCMYRLHELGDCFMVTFTAAPREPGPGALSSRMLIDCGSFRNSGVSTARLDKIATAIAKELAGAPIDVVVGTHQHNDHLSGFVHCEQAFRTIGVEQVWLSWLDNPLDKKAQKIGEGPPQSDAPAPRRPRRARLVVEAFARVAPAGGALVRSAGRRAGVLRGERRRAAEGSRGRREDPQGHRHQEAGVPRAGAHARYAWHAARQRARPRARSAPQRRRPVPQGSEEGRELRPCAGVGQSARLPVRRCLQGRRFLQEGVSRRRGLSLQSAVQADDGRQPFTRAEGAAEAIQRPR